MTLPARTAHRLFHKLLVCALVVVATSTATVVATPPGVRQTPTLKTHDVPDIQPAVQTKAPPSSALARKGMPTRNVKVTVNLSDRVGDAPPVVRTVVMTIADGHKGSVRSETYLRLNTEVPTLPNVYAGSDQQLPLMVDASVQLVEADTVLLHLLFNYRVFGGSAAGPDGVPVTRRDLSEDLMVLLTPGRPLVVSESADAISDRSVKVEVQADILP